VKKNNRDSHDTQDRKNAGVGGCEKIEIQAILPIFFAPFKN
jgi:hypothetical protein